MELIYVTLRNVYLAINKVAWLSLWQVDDQLTVKKNNKKTHRFIQLALLK